MDGMRLLSRLVACCSLPHIRRNLLAVVGLSCLFIAVHWYLSRGEAKARPYVPTFASLYKDVWMSRYNNGFFLSSLQDTFYREVSVGSYRLILTHNGGRKHKRKTDPFRDLRFCVPPAPKTCRTPFDENGFHFLKTPLEERLFGVMLLDGEMSVRWQHEFDPAWEHQVLINGYPLSRYSGLIAAYIHERRNQVN
jgi:hypothetical protein